MGNTGTLVARGDYRFRIVGHHVAVRCDCFVCEGWHELGRGRTAAERNQLIEDYLAAAT